MRIKFHLTILLAIFCSGLFGQSPPQDWFHLDPERDNYNGVSTYKVYDDMRQAMRCSQPCRRHVLPRHSRLLALARLCCNARPPFLLLFFGRLFGGRSRWLRAWT